MAEPTIKTLWGLAKSPELHMTDEELHLIVLANTGRESIRELTRGELRTVIGVLAGLKDSASGKRKSGMAKRGVAGTGNQRRKIYQLAESLGWDKLARVNGMCRKMFGVERVEWLNCQQCRALIEALKSMAGRKGGTG